MAGGRKQVEQVLPDWVPQLGLRDAAAILGMGKDTLYKLLENSTVAEAEKPALLPTPRRTRSILRSRASAVPFTLWAWQSWLIQSMAPLPSHPECKSGYISYRGRGSP